MFYEERIIDGILHCRSHPDGEWEMVSPENMTLKIERLQAKLLELEAKIKDLDSRPQAQRGPRYTTEAK